VSNWHREALVAARADAILASAPTTRAYAQHFDAQLRATRFRALGRRSLRMLLRVLRGPDSLWLAMMLFPCVLLGPAAHAPTVAPHLAPHLVPRLAPHVGQAPS
jgi:hypothetical protein